MLRKIIAIGLLITWMSVIFSFSNQQGESSSNTSRKISEKIVYILDSIEEYTDLEKQKTIEKLEPVIRKLAHYAIYTLGGIIIMNFLYVCGIQKTKLVIYSAICGIIYAISDEIHQLFISGRSGRIEDVIIDSIGIFTGIAVYIFCRQIINYAKTLEGGKQNELRTI